MALEQNVGGSGELFVGEDKTLYLEVLDENSTPVNTGSWVSVRFVVRKKDGTADPAIFDKAASRIGTYNATRALNSERWSVVLTDDELNTVRKFTYRYSWKRLDNDAETILAYGNFAPQLATAR